MSRARGRLASWQLIAKQVFDGWCFRRQRADYYDYLSGFMRSVGGARTLKDIFSQDAQRYGVKTTRGRLSAQWAAAYPMSGGDLHATWRGVLPEDELVIVRVAQLAGNVALIDTLHDLAAVQRLVANAREILVNTVTVAVIALLVWVVMMLLVPLFTVPRLVDVFGMLPTEYYGSATRRLFAFSRFSGRWWGWVILGVVCAVCWVGWSFSNLVGPVRQWLDRFLIWRLYRCVATVRMLSVLHVVLVRHEGESTQLRSALAMLRRGANRWQAWHLDQMMRHIDRGWVGARTFDTGLFDRALYWYLQDMVLVRGLVEGLNITKQRLGTQILHVVSRQAALARWVMLLWCVGAMLGLGVWHYVAIDELRRGLMIFYAGQ
ncbi:general secretion pathway protein [Pusillimonas minor]|uniref:General secretion pathway protein n=1 Tax=Pusillimonas minor TaxID=2697024 RepID=A0A842HPR1_9BURK|nr:general secretion pathway protein [Pusillimonas minor]MBC2770307.1 general secretion pathway protein [Pusillimonas minor]